MTGNLILPVLLFKEFPNKSILLPVKASCPNYHLRHRKGLT